MNRILILGASGFIGNTLYKELVPYFDVYGTYCHENELYEDNKVFFRFDHEKDDLLEVLEKTRPNFIISSLRGNFSSQYDLHKQLSNFVLTNEHCTLLFLSSANVFDGKFQFPSYENDLPLAESEYGKFKLSVEKLLRQLPPEK